MDFLNFGHLICPWILGIEVYVRIHTIVVSIKIFELDFFAGLNRYLVLQFFLHCFSWGSGLLEYCVQWCVRSSWFGCFLWIGMLLNWPDRRQSKLSSSSVFESLMSDNCCAPGCSRTNSWHHSTYLQCRISCLFGTKASCMCYITYMICSIYILVDI
jgi:hypothetical protein